MTAAKAVWKCGRCGEGEIQLVQLMAHYCVECDLCGSMGPVEETTEKAVAAWNEKQRSMFQPKGSENVH